MKILENKNLENEIKNGIYLIDFYADWCGPCKMLSQVLENIKEIDIIKVNVDKFPSLASKYKVMSIPKLVYTKDGEVIFEQTGVQTEESINEVIDKLKQK